MAGGKDRGRHAAGKHRGDRFRIPLVTSTPPPAGKVYGTPTKYSAFLRLFGGSSK